MYRPEKNEHSRQQEMRDPFKPNTNKQLVREAQFGFAVIGILVAILIYVAWYRLNGLHDQTPEHIRDAPIAVQVFPNSPNYDRQTHEMIQREDSTHKMDMASVSKPKKQTLADAPRRMMDDSQKTARQLSTSASAIDRSVTRVASMIRDPRTKTKAVASPAVPSKGSGFRPLKPPVRKQPAATATHIPAPTKSVSAVGSNEFKPLKSPPKVTKPASTIGVFKPNKFQPKPISLPSPKQPVAKTVETKPSTFGGIGGGGFSLTPGSGSRALKPQPDSRTNEVSRPVTLPKVTPSSFTPKPNTGSFAVPEPVAELPKQKVHNPFSTSAASKKAPTVKTVSFQSATWVVKEGDSFWSIAESNYGDGRFFRALYETNRRLVPGFEDLAPGVELQIPSQEQLIKKHARLCPADVVHANDPLRVTPDEMMNDLTDDCDSDIDQRLYETKSADTLFKIARRELGQASRYVELIDLNRFRIDDDVTHETLLPTGIKLLLPEK